LDEGRIAARVDARPPHAKGENPMGTILRAAKDVPEGRILHLRNTFEPLPLYDLLGKQGFAPWARRNGMDDWEVFFYRARPGEEMEPSGEAASGQAASRAGARPVASVRIDVSQLTPPEPMQRVLEALAQLEPGQTLLVQHVQRPLYLYTKLDQLGHAHQTWEMGPGHVEILIRVGERE
jgi:uncharacterized protein (DUF2249 family)